MLLAVRLQDSKFAPDGGYIPRVLFLSPAGEVLDVTNVEGNARYKYYYGAPSQIVSAMKTALTRFPAAVEAEGGEGREEL